jgi:hypothetical protein
LRFSNSMPKRARKPFTAPRGLRPSSTEGVSSSRTSLQEGAVSRRREKRAARAAKKAQELEKLKNAVRRPSSSYVKTNAKQAII